MTIYTMGFTQKDARQFFERIRANEIELLVDIRLNNQSQLAGFTKGRDLPYFLEMICHCRYDHNEALAPTRDILDRYKKGDMSWDEYEVQYGALMERREVSALFEKKYGKFSRVLLLCSEPTPEKCHRRLLAEKLQRDLGYSVIHL